jgi:diacylglycerol kinase
MLNKSNNIIVSFFKSFGYAFKGLSIMFIKQRNFYVHLLAMLVAISAAFYYPLTSSERALIIIMIALVLAAETFNTSIEKLTDLVIDDYNEKAGQVKDLAAAAVLILAISSVIIAVIIFWPYIFV